MKHPHAELMMEYAKDAMETETPWMRWQVRDGPDDEWQNCCMPLQFNHYQAYRRKPQKKVFDLSVLIRSQIDCEFGRGAGIWSTTRGKLKGIVEGANTHKYKSPCERFWSICRPRMNHWHHWRGGECPLPEGLMVAIQYRNSGTDKGPSTVFNWLHRDWDTDIIGFSVIGIADGWVWPWEAGGE